MKITDKYSVSLAFISLMVAFLIHFPELVSLFDTTEQSSLFPGMTWGDVGNEVFFTFLSLLLLFGINTVVFGFNRASVQIGWKKLSLSFMFTWLINNLLGKGFVGLHHSLDIPAIDATVHHYLHPLRDFMMTCIVSGSCYMIYLIRRSQEVRSESQRIQVENQKLRAENLLNQYEALKNQLNPHMLFNSLNTLQSLIRENPDKAQDYLQELSRVLRYTLHAGNDSQSVTLQEEMDFVLAYLFLLKMRYEDNLQFDICLEENTAALHLPPMSVQLLIENAVKHNEISNRKPLTIRVEAAKGQLAVSNSLQPKRSRSRGPGIGLANLSKRYNLLFKKDIDVKQENGRFCVMIPLIALDESTENEKTEDTSV